jgi:hypothetical protein
VGDYPDAISQALTALRLAGVGGPYNLVLSADAYTAVNETSVYGYPVHEHIARLLDGQIIWAPAIEGAFLLSGRGGDFELRIGQDLSIGYLSPGRHRHRAVLPGDADLPRPHLGGRCGAHPGGPGRGLTPARGSPPSCGVHPPLQAGHWPSGASEVPGAK